MWGEITYQLPNLGLDLSFYTTFCNGCNYLSMLELQLKFTPFWVCSHHNSSPIEARVTKFGPQVQNTLVKSVSWSPFSVCTYKPGLFHIPNCFSLNTLHVYWSRQPRVFHHFTSLLLKAAIIWYIWFVWWYDVDSCCLSYFQVKDSNITVAVPTLDLECMLVLAGKLDEDIQLTLLTWPHLLEAWWNDGEYISTLSSTMLFAWTPEHLWCR